MSLEKVDVERLRKLNVPEEIIEVLDIRNGGNIDDEGNVLFLDEERQKRKENPDKPMRVNRPNGLGMKNALLRMVSEKTAEESKKSVNSKNPAFEMIADSVGHEGESIRKQVVTTMLGFGEKGYTHGNVLPLNLDLAEQTKTGILPIQLVFEAIEEAEYIAILNTCICRQSFQCEDYPIDMGCIFLNAAGRRVVETGLAIHATVEQAKEHVLKAKETGLFANAEMVEGEQYVWGLRNDQMNEFRMICFCCPCCCLAMKTIKFGSSDVKKRFASCGYTSVIKHSKCVGCHKCQSVCPQQAITYREDGKAVIDQEKCMGCGYCKMECESDAITIKQTFPMRESINEYFLKEARIDDGLEHKK